MAITRTSGAHGRLAALLLVVLAPAAAVPPLWTGLAAPAWWAVDALLAPSRSTLHRAVRLKRLDVDACAARVVCFA